MSEISESLEDCVGGRPVGSRESKNIIPSPSVSLHFRLKNASKNGERGSAENGFSHHHFSNTGITGSRSGSLREAALASQPHSQSCKPGQQPHLRLRNSYFQVLLGGTHLLTGSLSTIRQHSLILSFIIHSFIQAFDSHLGKPLDASVRSYREKATGNDSSGLTDAEQMPQAPNPHPGGSPPSSE